MSSVVADASGGGAGGGLVAVTAPSTSSAVTAPSASVSPSSRRVYVDAFYSPAATAEAVSAFHFTVLGLLRRLRVAVSAAELQRALREGFADNAFRGVLAGMKKDDLHEVFALFSLYPPKSRGATSVPNLLMRLSLVAEPADEVSDADALKAIFNDVASMRHAVAFFVNRDLDPDQAAFALGPGRQPSERLKQAAASKGGKGVASGDAESVSGSDDDSGHAEAKHALVARAVGKAKSGAGGGKTSKVDASALAGVSQAKGALFDELLARLPAASAAALVSPRPKSRSRSSASAAAAADSASSSSSSGTDESDSDSPASAGALVKKARKGKESRRKAKGGKKHKKHGKKDGRSHSPPAAVSSSSSSSSDSESDSEALDRKRIAPRVFADFVQASGSAYRAVQRLTFRTTRNQNEVEVLARAADAFNDGDAALCFEIIMRRLLGVLWADKSGNWAHCSAVEWQNTDGLPLPHKYVKFFTKRSVAFAPNAERKDRNAGASSRRGDRASQSSYNRNRPSGSQAPPAGAQPRNGGGGQPSKRGGGGGGAAPAAGGAPGAPPAGH